MPFTNKDKTDLKDFFNLLKVRKKNDVIYQNIYVVGLLCLFLIWHHLNTLLIPIKDLGLIVITVDLLITLCFFKFYKKHFSIAWALFHNLTVGVMITYLFILTNASFSNKPNLIKVLPIENIDLQDNHQRHNRGLEPVITVNINGNRHTISFDASSTKEAINSRHVSVTLKKGFWGYWVLTNIYLIK